MSTDERRQAAQANQWAAAFIRFQLMGDHEAMQFVLDDLAFLDEDEDRLAFVTALASIAGAIADRTMGRDDALDHLREIAESSAALACSDDIDDFFDLPPPAT